MCDRTDDDKLKQQHTTTPNDGRLRRLWRQWRSYIVKKEKPDFSDVNEIA